jgi:hypothetical protein
MLKEGLAAGLELNFIKLADFLYCICRAATIQI